MGSEKALYSTKILLPCRAIEKEYKDESKQSGFMRSGAGNIRIYRPGDGLKLAGSALKCCK
jgi:hypothetical protein